MYISASKNGVEKKFTPQIWATLQQSGGHGWVIAPPEAVQKQQPENIGQPGLSDLEQVFAKKPKKAKNEVPN